MDETKQTGRTFWDLAHWLASSSARTVIGILALSLLLLVVLGTIIASVHFAAQPETDISLFYGLVQYKKAQVLDRPSPSLLLPQSADTNAYVLPQGIIFEEGRPVVLFDRTLNITKTGYGHTRLAGANIHNIRVAIRGADGSILRPQVDHQQLTVEVQTDKEPFFELEYKGNYFAIEVKSAGELPGYYLTALKLKTPSMDLKRVNEF